METSSKADHLETREPHFIEDGIPATKFTGRPIAHIRQQIEAVLLNPAVIVHGNEALAATQVELWLFVIYKRIIYRPETLANAIQRLQDKYGIWNLPGKDVTRFVEELSNLKSRLADGE